MPIIDERYFRAPVYSGESLNEIAFPLGGIGTGTVSLCGNGSLAEWQIQNQPDQDSMNPHSCFMLWAQEQGEAAVTRVCEGQIPSPYNRHPKMVNGLRFPGGGLGDSGLFGLPRFAYATFHGAYPFAKLDLSDPQMPVLVSLEAYNPMVPMDADASGIPAALFRFKIRNACEKPVKISLAANIHNPVGDNRVAGRRNTFCQEDGMSAMVFSHDQLEKNTPAYGDVAIGTNWPETFACQYWPRLAWFDGIQYVWDQFSTNGFIADQDYDESPAGVKSIGTLGMRAEIAPGETIEIPVWLTWSFPRYEYQLRRANDAGAETGSCATKPNWTNYYANQFPSAMSVQHFLKQEEANLYAKTWRFRQCLDDSSLDPVLLSAITSQMSIIRSPTAIRMEDGTYYGFEGCAEQKGCCPGSCDHVWNYAQAHAHLYPQLDASMHETSFTYNFSPSGSGAMAFRVQIPPQPQTQVPNPAVDAQMGKIIKAYQYWKISGDQAWMRQHWPRIKDAMAFAWKYWDSDEDGYIDGIQHNTYDIEFYGPNALAQSYYLGALSCCREIAAYFDEQELAEKYQQVMERGAEKTSALLFNGEYFIQRVDPESYKQSELDLPAPKREVPTMAEGEPKWQFANGCLSDQLAGICLTRIAGAEVPLDAEQVALALQSIYRYNFKRNLRTHENCQRAFALQDEAALVLCTWPHGDRPALPFIYCDEAWTGIEYQVAVHLLAEGMDEEAHDIVRAVRARYDGKYRNPWNEFECGSYYARAMSSWGLLLASSGQINDAPNKRLGFHLDKERCGYFWTAQEAWGFVRRQAQFVRMRLGHGQMQLDCLEIHGPQAFEQASVNGRVVATEIDGPVIRFAETLSLSVDDCLELH